MLFCVIFSSWCRDNIVFNHQILCAQSVGRSCCCQGFVDRQHSKARKARWPWQGSLSSSDQTTRRQRREAFLKINYLFISNKAFSLQLGNPICDGSKTTQAHKHSNNYIIYPFCYYWFITKVILFFHKN
jgi:hypothetical protein